MSYPVTAPARPRPPLPASYPFLRSILEAGVIASAIMLAAAANLHAQVNIERLRRGESTGWGASLNADVAVRSGNVDLVQLGLGGRVDYAQDRATTFLVASGDLGWQGGERFSNEALTHLRGIYKPAAQVWPEAFVQVNYDKSRLLTFRFLVGGGVRIGLVSTGNVELSWGSDYMFEREELDLPADAGHPDQTAVHRWSNYVSIRVGFNDQTSLVLVTYAQPQLDNFGDTRILSETRFGVDVAEAVALVLTFRLNVDTRPPDGIEEVDANLKAGVGLRF